MYRYADNGNHRTALILSSRNFRLKQHVNRTSVILISRVPMDRAQKLFAYNKKNT